MNNGDTMARGKPRGSISGLQARQSESAHQTNLALWRAYEMLLSIKPEITWSEIELCRMAGLKSTVSLHAARNEELLKLLRAHNEKVQKEVAGEEKGELEKLGRECPRLSAELARRDAENGLLQQENRMLRRKVSSLKLQLDALRSNLRR